MLTCTLYVLAVLVVQKNLSFSVDQDAKSII